MKVAYPVAAIVALALTAGCGGSSKKDEAAAQPTPNIVQPGAPGEQSRKLTPEQAAAAAEEQAVRPTEADVQFMQDMIHHHSQAIEMAGWVPSRAESRSVKLIARRMELSQEGEIELMERWLKAEGVEPMSDHEGHGTLMPGMLTEKQMDRLEAGDGRTFDRLFLRYMTQHHRGALTMVRQLREAGGGAQSEIDAFARDVESDQQIEINRMQDLLAAR